jgi:hypothetical protein
MLVTKPLIEWAFVHVHNGTTEAWDAFATHQGNTRDTNLFSHQKPCQLPTDFFPQPVSVTVHCSS